MNPHFIAIALLCAASALLLVGAERPTTRPAGRVRFNPEPLRDEWNNWLVGQWTGTGQSDTGRGRGTVKIELALNGQFRIHTEESVITEMTPDQVEYLKKNMHASDEEIERFKSQPYRAIEIYTIDQKTGETVAYLFDSLRCIATGRGTREGDRETIYWEWATGHKSTRITEKAGNDRIIGIQRTPMPDGSVMEEKGQSTRIRR